MRTITVIGLIFVRSQGHPQMSLRSDLSQLTCPVTLGDAGSGSQTGPDLLPVPALIGFAVAVHRACVAGAGRHPLTEPSQHAISALKIPGRISGAAMTLRLTLGAVFALSVLAIPQVVSPEPVAAGSSCTGWTSITTPPRTIKVLRTRTGAIEKVDFRKYVAKVMASGEWPSRLKMATLEAGALATKQYAWYYAMKGHHRSGYVRGSKCYDVRDDTNDQLYKHYASPTSRQKEALAKTWGLTLRKKGRFFLTGYRAGSSTSCGADANGWKLYAKSVQACANKGWSSTRILKKYLSPNLAFVWSNNGPTVSTPKVVLKVGNSVSSGAATVSWNPQPRKANVSGFKLQRKVSGGNWKALELPSAKAWKTDAWVKLGSHNRFRVRAKNGKGKWGPWSYSPRRRAAVRGPAGTTLAGATSTAAGPPAKVRTSFIGRSVALVAHTGPKMGKVKVFVDGKYKATVDLARPKSTKRKLVWAKNWARAGSHSIAIKAVSPKARVNFNGFFVLR